MLYLEKTTDLTYHKTQTNCITLQCNLFDNQSLRQAPNIGQEILTILRYIIAIFVMKVVLLHNCYMLSRRTYFELGTLYLNRQKCFEKFVATDTNIKENTRNTNNLLVLLAEGAIFFFYFLYQINQIHNTLIISLLKFSDYFYHQEIDNLTCLY